MNYRHAFHAGNFADVLKHAVIALVLQHLVRKATPFRVVDVHAGRGLYDLAGEAAERTGEWRRGIGRLVGAGVPALDAAAETALAPWRMAVKAVNADGMLRYYPGSPLIARALLRPGDRLIANELHPVERIALEAALAGERRAKVLNLDAWTALKALLPPPERRGLVIIDPPFEAAGEFDRLAAGVRRAQDRFATGTYVIWYPLKDLAAAAAFLRRLKAPKRLVAELRVARPTPDGPLSACGVAVLNPPWTLEADLRALLPALVRRLAVGDGAGWHLAALAEPVAGDRPPAAAAGGANRKRRP